MDDAASAGGGVDDGAAASYDAYVAAYYDDVSGPQIREAADPGVAAYTSPAGGGDVALADTYLV